MIIERDVNSRVLSLVEFQTALVDVNMTSRLTRTYVIVDHTRTLANRAAQPAHNPGGW